MTHWMRGGVALTGDGGHDPAPAGRPASDCRDAVYLDVKAAFPRKNVDEDACGRILREIASVDPVDRAEFFDGGTIHVALEDVFERRSRRLQTQFHLFEHKFGLTLDRDSADF